MRAATWLLAMVSLVVFGTAGAARADVPAIVPIQGYLTDDAGAPVTSSVSMLVALYATDSGGSPVFSETHDVAPEGGFFTIHLGDLTTLALTTFRDNQALFVSIAIDGGAELEPRMPLETIPYAAYAQFAGDAATVGGRAAGTFASSTVGAGLSVNASNEISVDATVIQTQIDTTIGTMGVGNPMNHTRYDDTEAVAAVAAADQYVRNSGDTVTGSLTVSGQLISTGGAEMRAGVRWNCPTGMTRVGRFCMNNLRGFGTFTSAVSDCHSQGLAVCPLQALVYCDILNTPPNCATDTDPPAAPGPSLAVITGDTAPGGRTLGNVVMYYARDASNVEDVTTIENGDSTNRRYYCCAPIHGL